MHILAVNIDEVAVQSWVDNEYPKIQKAAKKQGAAIYWTDEAAIRSDGPLGRTWGLEGKMPVFKTSDQRQSINAISTLSNKGGFWYHLYTERFNAEKFIECLRDFMKYRKKPVFMIMDGHPVHKAKKIKAYVESLEEGLLLFLQPPYTPGLNPDEPVWRQMKQLGTSKKPLKKGESLKNRAMADLHSIKVNKSLIRTVYCGRAENHDYLLYLALNDIDHTKTKAQSP